MRGRPTCPTGQKKNSVEATAGSARFLLLQGKVGYQNRPLIRPGFAGPPSPRGEGFRAVLDPSRLQNHLPSPPSWGAGRYGRGTNGPQVSRVPQKKVGQEEEPFLPGSPTFKERKGPRGCAPGRTTRRVRSTAPVFLTCDGPEGTTCRPPRAESLVIHLEEIELQVLRLRMGRSGACRRSAICRRDTAASAAASRASGRRGRGS